MLDEKQFDKRYVTEAVFFHDVESTFFTCRFAQKGDDMIFHFYGTQKCSPTAINKVLEQSFVDCLGEDSKKFMSFEFINDELLDGVETIFVNVKTLCRNELALRKMRKDVFETLHKMLGERHA